MPPPKQNKQTMDMTLGGDSVSIMSRLVFVPSAAFPILKHFHRKVDWLSVWGLFSCSSEHLLSAQ